MTYSDKQISESRKEALIEIEKFLNADDIEAQFEKVNGDYHSKERFWFRGNQTGMALQQKNQ